MRIAGNLASSTGSLCPLHMRKYLPILLILLLAAALRLAQLTQIPPGLTHDEANHGREAIDVLDGELRYFFPYNYGSEPLYSYTVAGAMALLGENVLALRLVNVAFSLATIAVTYAWANRALDRRVALITAVLLAISFWPLASSRQALRAGMLPFFMGTAVWLFWLFWQRNRSQSAWIVIGFALALVATLHIYLAARVAWVLFPLFLLYLALRDRPLAKRGWRPTIMGLGLTAVLVTPMFLYLRQNPEVQPRVSMLDNALQALRAGNLTPIFTNARDALLAFFWPGYGDQFLAYNIPGRPIFDPLTALFFLLGLFIALRFALQHTPLTTHHSQFIIPHSSAFILIWFFSGILPSLITGPTANTTRNLAALAPTFLLPALGFVSAFDWLLARLRLRHKKEWLLGITAVAWLLLAGFWHGRDYFATWAQDPEVRTAYQVTQIAMFAYVNQRGEEALLSTALPGPAHDPSIALMTYPQARLHWSDARYALLWPRGEAAHAIIPASTPPHPFFAPWLRPLEEVNLRPTDLDPRFTYYELAAPATEWLRSAPIANFGAGVLLRYAAWLEGEVLAGETAVLLTVWQVTDPTRLGPRVPPADVTEGVLFTQILNKGGVLAQRDSLEAPTWDWRPGDVIAQLHPIAIPTDTPPGTYPAIVGLYDRASGVRLPVLDENGRVLETFANAPPLMIKR